MKTKFLAIGLLTAAMATTVVFADDTTAPATNGTTAEQQAPVSNANTTATAPAQNSSMSGTGQVAQ